MKKVWIILFVFINLIVWCKTGDSITNEKYKINCNLLSEWKTMYPSSQGISDKIIKNIYIKAKAVTNIESLLIVKNGFIIGEKYYKKNNVDRRNWIRSVTKSVMSILIGIAIEKGFIKSIEEPVKNYLSKITDLLKEGKVDIKIKHLLTMTSGFDWDESTVTEFNNYTFAKNQVDHLLSRDLVDRPGTKFNYNSASTNLLSVIIEEASGMNTFIFAKKYLFDKLGINNPAWAKNRQGYFDGGAGLLLRSRDMAKIGMMMIYKGNNGSEIIVSENWVNESLKSHIKRYYSDYGYLWWLTEVKNTKVCFARGFAGQYIFIVPSRNIVVVGTTDFLNSKGKSGKQNREMFNLITNEVLNKIL